VPGGPGLLDPCEREPVDAAANLTLKQRELITSTAQVQLPLDLVGSGFFNSPIKLTLIFNFLISD